MKTVKYIASLAIALFGFFASAYLLHLFSGRSLEDCYQIAAIGGVVGLYAQDMRRDWK